MASIDMPHHAKHHSGNHTHCGKCYLLPRFHFGALLFTVHRKLLWVGLLLKIILLLLIQKRVPCFDYFAHISVGEPVFIISILRDTRIIHRYRLFCPPQPL